MAFGYVTAASKTTKSSRFLQMNIMKEPKKLTTQLNHNTHHQEQQQQQQQQFITKESSTNAKPVVVAKDLDSKKTDIDFSFNVLFEKGSSCRFPLFPTKEQQYENEEMLKTINLNLIKHSLLMELSSSSVSEVDKRSLIRDAIITSMISGDDLETLESKPKGSNMSSGGLMKDWSGKF